MPEDFCLLGLLLESNPIQLTGSVDSHGCGPLHICVEWVAEAVSGSRIPYRKLLKKNLFGSAFPYIISRLIASGCDLHATAQGYTPTSLARAFGSEELDWWSAIIEPIAGINVEQILENILISRSIVLKL